MESRVRRALAVAAIALCACGGGGDGPDGASGTPRDAAASPAASVPAGSGVTAAVETIDGAVTATMTGAATFDGRMLATCDLGGEGGGPPGDVQITAESDDGEVQVTFDAPASGTVDGGTSQGSADENPYVIVGDVAYSVPETLHVEASGDRGASGSLSASRFLLVGTSEQVDLSLDLTWECGG